MRRRGGGGGEVCVLAVLPLKLSRIEEISGTTQAVVYDDDGHDKEGLDEEKYGHGDGDEQGDNYRDGNGDWDGWKGEETDREVERRSSSSRRRRR